MLSVKHDDILSVPLFPLALQPEGGTKLGEIHEPGHDDLLAAAPAITLFLCVRGVL